GVGRVLPSDSPSRQIAESAVPAPIWEERMKGILHFEGLTMIARSSLLVLVLGTIPLPRSPAPLPPSLLSGLTWRNLGPFRAGRVSVVSEPVGQPGVYHIGPPMRGVG